MRLNIATFLEFLFSSLFAFALRPPSPRRRPPRKTRFLSNARQLIFEGKRSGEGYFSPDGKKLIFQSEREPENPFYQNTFSIWNRARRRASRRDRARRRADFSSRAQIACSSLRRTTIPKRWQNKRRSWNFARAESSGATRGITTRRWIFSPRSRTAREPRQPDEIARLRRGGSLFAGWKTDRFLFAARGVSARKTSRRSSASVTRKTRPGSATSTS